MEYLGHLQRTDPLYEFIHWEIQHQMGLSGEREYRVFRMNASNSVYLYEDTRTGKHLIGKFFNASGHPSREAAHRAMENEFHNLNYLRSFGFDGRSCHYVARPLGRNSDLNELLMEEGCSGESLSSVLIRSIRGRDAGLLYRKLAALGYFLSSVHNRTANGDRVDFRPVSAYARDMTETLFQRSFISAHRREVFHGLISRWSEKPEMFSDNQVIVHGDATPENFLFGDGNYVITFDLERMRRADRMFDAGRLCAEIAHFFMLYAGNRGGAEPFIGSFLWEYSCHFPDRNAAFRSITARLPYYMGINFLRIARNWYFDWNYRQELLNAASQCLKGPL